MKNFPVDTIHTTPEGRVIISGPKGSIDISRYDNTSHGQYWHTAYEQTPEENRKHNIHVITVEQLTKNASQWSLGCGETFHCHGVVGA